MEVEVSTNHIGKDVGRLAARERRRSRQHPAPEKIEAYQEKRLPASEQEQIGEHLSTCNECASFVLALAAEDQPELMAETGLTDDQIEADFLAASKLAETAGQISQEPAPVIPIKPGPRLVTIWHGLAASLLIGTIMVLSGNLISLRRDLDRFQSVSANTPILDLLPVGDIDRHGEETAVELTFPDHVPSLTVILNVFDLKAFPQYEVEIRERQEPARKALTVSDLKASEEGNFTLAIARGALPAGTFEITLFGVRDGKQEPMEVYLVRLGNEPEQEPAASKP